MPLLAPLAPPRADRSRIYAPQAYKTRLEIPPAVSVSHVRPFACWRNSQFSSSAVHVTGASLAFLATRPGLLYLFIDPWDTPDRGRAAIRPVGAIGATRQRPQSESGRSVDVVDTPRVERVNRHDVSFCKRTRCPWRRCRYPRLILNVWTSTAFSTSFRLFFAAFLTRCDALVGPISSRQVSIALWADMRPRSERGDVLRAVECRSRRAPWPDGCDLWDDRWQDSVDGRVGAVDGSGALVWQSYQPPG